MDVIVGYLIIAGVFITLGLVSIKQPPKEKNSIVGFRTRKSSKSQRNWDIAQSKVGKAMLVTGIICLLTLIISSFFDLQYILLEAMLVIIVVLFILFCIYINFSLPD